MDINASIPDEQAAALAQILRVQTYTDGKDFITQVGASALLEYSKRALIGGIASEPKQATLDAATAGYNTLATTPIKPPPIKPKGP